LRFLSLLLLGVALGHSYRIDDWLTEFSAEQGNEDKAAEGKIWVVLVAGSNGWYNYRHQSDICHIYQLLVRNHAIPRENIVTMMYNDIAYNRENPTPGTIINALHAGDVYEGVMIDYMGDDVNPKTFLDVLAGKDVHKGSRKTVRSTKDDIIFVNFVDHGGPGILAFPSGELNKVDLDSTMNQMFEGGRYKQMLMYIEACYSGSMFTKMSDKMGITAHTAANADESSYACVMDEDLNTYLGDCWSLNWMNNTETIAPGWNKETVGQQYQIVKKMTTESHAMLYGDLTTIPNEPLSTFLGTPGEKRWKMEVGGERNMKSIQSQDVMVDWLKRKLEKENDEEVAEDLKRQIKFHEEYSESGCHGGLVEEEAGEGK